MSISFTGDVPSSTERVELGLHSLDHSLEDSLGNFGWPLRSLIELYGPKSIGKTSLALSVLGIIAAKKHKQITIVDFEIQERNTIEQMLKGVGYSGEVFYIMNKDKERPEDTLGRFTDRMFEKNPDVALVDSLGGYRPNAELEGKIGDRNVGQKALEIGQLSGRLIRGLQLADKPNSIFMTNHMHPNIGSMVQGHTTSGGETKKYLSHVRMALKRCFLGKKVAKFDGSWLIQGHVDSNRFGFSGRDFYAYLVEGEGIHLGLTAMWECIIKEYAELSSKSFTEGTTVSMDSKSYGKLGTILRDRNTEPELFVPFLNRMKAEKVTQCHSSKDDVSPNDEKPQKSEKKRGRKPKK